MVGEKFEVYFSQMAKNYLKLSTMVEEKFEIWPSEIDLPVTNEGTVSNNLYSKIPRYTCDEILQCN